MSLRGDVLRERIESKKKRELEAKKQLGQDDSDEDLLAGDQFVSGGFGFDIYPLEMDAEAIKQHKASG